jgi:acyl carrier protein
VEEALVQIVAEVLKVETLGIHESFFDLGANSVTAIQLISRIRERFQVEVPLRRLFDGPSVAQVAAALVETQTEAVADDEMSELLAELEGLSDEEAQRLLELETKTEDDS